ncbi:MAG: efflux RND transporter permease subunit, partial [Bacteroidota bacterium]
MLKIFIRFFLYNPLVAGLLLLTVLVAGLVTSPFGASGFLPSDPVPVDAIPDLGENQQIVFVKWPGHSPEDIEDQITYPLTSALLGLAGVRTIRASSMQDFASIYVIFEDDVEFYWSRARLLEKLNALPPDLLPPEVQPMLGPDATGLGQVFWYTLEGFDEKGQPAGGWDLHELRSAQDFFVKYALASVEGVAEVASVGGFVKEYQVDVDPDRLQAHQISLDDVMRALQKANQDVGARTLEINRAEYMVRGIGAVESVADLEEAVVARQPGTVIRLRDVANVGEGPADRSGILDKSGAEAVGGVVVARFGANPMAVIAAIKDKIKEIAPGMPSRKLEDGTVSQLRVVPFYDRSGLIKETLGTLESALRLEILVTMLVIVLLVLELRASLLVSAMLPLAVLACFVLMRYGNVDANIVALSGIAIAIGTIVDMGIVLVENILRHLREASASWDRREVILEGATEVSGAIVTAVLTTIVSFIPVLTMEAAEGKLFGPLAWTKTFVLAAAVVLTLALLPTLVHLSLRLNLKGLRLGRRGSGGWRPSNYLPDAIKRHGSLLFSLVVALVVTWFLTQEWLPLGTESAFLTNFIFVLLLVGGLIGVFYLFMRF